MAQKFTTPIVIRNITSAASDALAVSVDGEAADRIKFEAGGRLVWGGGASAGDVNLYRDAADALKTDDSFEAAAGVITLTTSGTPTSSIADGAIAIDTTNDTFYFKSSGTWQEVSGGGASVTISDTPPSAPENGNLWYESDTGLTFIYYDDGTSQQWVEVGGGAGISSYMQDAAPASPISGDIWFETDTGITYIYYDDGSSAQWIEIGVGGGGGGGGASVTVSDTAPASPTEGDMWFESDTGKLLVYYDSVWVEVGGTGGGGSSSSTITSSSTDAAILLMEIGP